MGIAVNGTPVVFALVLAHCLPPFFLLDVYLLDAAFFVKA